MMLTFALVMFLRAASQRLRLGIVDYRSSYNEEPLIRCVLSLPSPKVRGQKSEVSSKRAEVRDQMKLRIADRELRKLWE